MSTIAVICGAGAHFWCSLRYYMLCWSRDPPPPAPTPTLPRVYRVSSRDQYLFGRRLGESHQGEVRYAIRRSDGESVAVKCVKRHRHSAKEVRYYYLLFFIFYFFVLLVPSIILALFFLLSTSACVYLILGSATPRKSCDTISSMYSYCYCVLFAVCI